MWRLLKSHSALVGVRIILAVLAPPLAVAHEAYHGSQQVVTASGDESAFLLANQTAMTKMMNDMAAKPTGDIDRDFVAMMVPHHQGAIDMAIIELRYGKNEQLRRIAQEIIVDQMQEIAVMKLAIGEPSSSSTPVPTEPGPTAADQPKQ
jgi:uncharacterized protein (DUF305 family)